MSERMEDIRDRALDEVDAAERRFRMVVALAAVPEAILLTVYLVLMDFNEVLHWLIFVAAILVYSTLAIGLVALGVYVRASTLRVLQALDNGDR